MAASVLLALLALQSADSSAALAARVEIARTEYGVPHILADDLKAMGFGLAYAQSEDYGWTGIVSFVKGRGTYARHVGVDSIDGDFVARELHALAVQTYHRLDHRARDVYEGFAHGLNHYIRLHPAEFPDWLEPDFTAIDVHSRSVQTWSRGDAQRFVRQQMPNGVERGPEPEGPVDDFAAASIGSNAWALAGTRTSSGHAILLRNPHLSWSAGYYEAHVRVPGLIDFYGDFRVGGALGIIGGFNRYLGWATTNNYPTYSQVYRLDAHGELVDHVVLDGEPIPLEARPTTVDYVTEAGSLVTETRTTWRTPYGPVIHRTDDYVFILKDPREGEFRRGEQFLKMMLATSLDEWLEVVRMRAHPSSNLTYADAAGNIAMYYNARLPLLPHETTGDTAAIAHSAGDMWSELVPWEDLPLYLNPPGGYVQQANDTPDFINLNVPLDRDTVVANLPEPRLRLRSQLSFQLVHGDRVVSLEEMLELKHSPRMLLTDRLLDDLIEIASRRGDEFGEEVDVLSRWDRTSRAESRGGTLFELWATRYLRAADSTAYAEPWDVERPTETPNGLGNPDEALDALRTASESLTSRGVPLDVAWGDMHRVVRGDVDVPVSGCSGGLGCFRTLAFQPTEDGRFAVASGDGWVLGVEFGETPRAYSILAYGQSTNEASPHHDDQAAMFARGQLKRVVWTNEAIEAATIRRYRPGEEVGR